MTRIRTRDELNQKRREYERSMKTQTKQILVCGGTGCVAGGSLKIFARLQEIMLEKGINCVVKLEKDPENAEKMKARLLELGFDAIIVET